MAQKGRFALHCKQAVQKALKERSQLQIMAADSNHIARLNNELQKQNMKVLEKNHGRMMILGQLFGSGKEETRGEYDLDNLDREERK